MNNPNYKDQSIKLSPAYLWNMCSGTKRRVNGFPWLSVNYCTHQWFYGLQNWFGQETECCPSHNLKQGGPSVKKPTRRTGRDEFHQFPSPVQSLLPLRLRMYALQKRFNGKIPFAKKGSSRPVLQQMLWLCHCTKARRHWGLKGSQLSPLCEEKMPPITDQGQPHSCLLRHQTPTAEAPSKPFCFHGQSAFPHFQHSMPDNILPCGQQNCLYFKWQQHLLP